MDVGHKFYSWYYLIPLVVVLSLMFSYLTVMFGLTIPIFVLTGCTFIVFLIIIFKSPFLGLMATVSYGFLYILVGRTLGIAFNFGYVVEALYFLLCLVVLFKTHKGDWRNLQNDIVLLFTLWFIISVLELINPAGASPRGWLHEIRTSGLDSFVLVLLGFLIFRNRNHLDVFLYVIIGCSILAAINGITQVHIGLTSPEQAFVTDNPTHMIWGKLRAFSFFRDAGQFGASQAQFAVICTILALGPYQKWKRIVLLICALVLFYGMLISGTRGSFFALVSGAFLAVVLFKNIKVLILGIVLMLSFIAVLKFTHIGSGNYHIYRFRSALNPEDASLNVRFTSQQALREYLKDHPFGGGLGVVGYAGNEYNSEKFISTIAPDSYWVKVWAMYGIVGFVFWFSMLMYIIGKCCGIVWKVKDANLRVKLISLTAGVFGIFISSYGNEVLNALPSSIVVYLSIVLINIGPKLDYQNSITKLYAKENP